MTIRWAIIGCGDVVRRRVAEAIRGNDGSELLAACRRDARELDAFCSRFGVARAYQSDDDLIADTDIDAVYIATPVNLHRPQTVKAAKAGKHVLVEKPMGLSVAECDDMVTACRAAGVKLGVAYFRRFYPVIARLKELLRSEAIGQPLSISAVTGTQTAFVPGTEGSWRVDLQQSGGGVLMDVGSHRINLFLDLFGEMVSVTAYGDTLGVDYDAESCASLIGRFESGVHANLQCFFGSGVDPDLFRVIGSHGAVSATPLNSGDLTIDVGGERRVEQHPPAPNFNTPQIADFVAAIAEDRNPLVDGEEGVRTNEVIERAYARRSPRT